MGNILSCTCNNKENGVMEYNIKDNVIKDQYDSMKYLKKNQDEQFTFSKSANHNIPKDELLNAVRITNLIRRIQKIFRLFKRKKINKYSQNNLENTKLDYENNDKMIVINNAKIIQMGVEKGKIKIIKKLNLDTITNLKDLKDTFKFLGYKINGLKEGFCIQYWRDGAYFKGQFLNNQANSIGKFFHSDGDDYHGEFKQDRAFGYGIYIHNNGAKFYGEWVDDCQSGYGIEVWKDGSEYKGLYSKGKKQGLGSYVWTDGSKYEGYWENNSLNGYGVYYFTDDKTYIGEWKDNMMHGYGEFHWKEGKKYAGYYQKDKKEGFGIYYWHTPNKAYIGFWNNGRQDGVGKYITQSKTRYGLWKDGIRRNWFSSETEALEFLKEDQIKFKTLFKFDLEEINQFLSN